MRLPRGAASVCGAAPDRFAWLWCVQLLLSAVASLSMRPRAAVLPLLVNEGSSARCLICARRPAARRAARTRFGQAAFPEREQESSTDGMRAGEMSGVGDTKRLVKLRVVEKATSGAKASQISQSLIGNSVQDRNKHIGLPQPIPALTDNNRGCTSKNYCNGPGTREKDVRH